MGSHLTHKEQPDLCHSNDRAESYLGERSETRTECQGHTEFRSGYARVVLDESESEKASAIVLESAAHQCIELDDDYRIGQLRLHSIGPQCRIAIALLDGFGCAE